MKLRALPIFALATASLASVPTLAGDLITVSQTVPADATTITQALLLAAPGDTVAVWGGTYQETVVVNQPVHLVSRGLGTVTVTGDLVIDGVSGLANEVSVVELRVQGQMRIRNCDAHVLVQDIIAHRSGMANEPVQRVAHSVTDCESVVIQSCSLKGREGAYQSQTEGRDGDHALEVLTSRVSIYGSVVTGGEGGRIGNGHYPHFVSGGDGGDGLRVLAGATVWSRGARFRGGEAGFDYFYGYPANGEVAGVDVRVAGGTHHDSGDSQFHFRLDAFNVAGDQPTLSISGPPGTAVYLLLADASGFRVFPPTFGNLHLENGHAIVPVGTIDSLGQLKIRIDTFDLLGEEADMRRIQLFGSGSQGRLLSHPRTWHVIR